MGVFDEDAEPFDLDESADEFDEDDLDDELDDATEDDVDLVVAAYREDGKPVVVPLDYDLANDLDELIRQLSRLPGDSGADGFVSVAGDFFVAVRVRGRQVEVLLSDATAAADWPLARDVLDYLGEDFPEDEDDPYPVGDMEMFAASGLRAFELEAIATDYDVDSDEAVERIAQKLKIGGEFQAAVSAFDD
ncbi:tRNA adenosine deaminase-associated protein [Tessaracoccus sp. OH4464_COT-324]|uniref:tRNA adenosine deaminase-associated protein n=1 Tax=Tessaracoccus sp. OH4464_COT-324 TaxID=2491059 RepID=UPI000F62FDDA|nr:tRNA adenosine deaminase-associated protein [Tessaracoccus sp. OH4464_COT-324]RRD45176.1 tRNA adenosine deaminase [Tessaracoccus sp. OH4464_COT-324]